MSETDTTAYGQSWYAATVVDAPRRPALHVDLDVDVCVIGGGLAGLTPGRELGRAGWAGGPFGAGGRESAGAAGWVWFWEGGRLAASASGRNTGFVLPGFAADAEKLIGRIGF